MSATTLLGILVAVAALVAAAAPAQRARWFDAQANQQARAAARGGPSTSAGLASQPAPLSRPAVLSPPVARPTTPPAPVNPASTTASPSFSGVSTGSGSLMSTTQHSSIGGLEVTTVLGPEVSRSSFEAFGGSAAASPVPPASSTMEELIDLEQQAEFFVVLGQDEAAMSLLEGYIDGTGKSPLPYLQLLEIHQRRADRDAYDNIRESFNERFNAHAPDWNVNLHRGRGLEDYPQTVALLQSLWTTPLSAMQELDRLLFRREEAEETFDFPGLSRAAPPLFGGARELGERRDRLRLDRPVPPARRRARRGGALAARGDGSHPSAARPGRGRPRRIAVAGRRGDERPARPAWPSGRRGAA